MLAIRPIVQTFESIFTRQNKKNTTGTTKCNKSSQYCCRKRQCSRECKYDGKSSFFRSWTLGITNQRILRNNLGLHTYRIVLTHELNSGLKCYQSIGLKKNLKMILILSRTSFFLMKLILVKRLCK